MIPSTKVRFDRQVSLMADIAGRLQRTQGQIATGQRLVRASDDPVAAARVARVDRQTQMIAAWRANGTLAMLAAEQADAALQGMTEAFHRARELVVLGASGTLSPADRQTLAVEMDGLAASVGNLAMARDASGQPIFPDGPLLYPLAAAIQLPAAPARTELSVGGRSLAQLLADAAQNIRNNAAPAAFADLDAGDAQLGSVRAHQGVRMTEIDAQMTRLEGEATSLKITRAADGDTDLTTAVPALQRDQLVLDATQAAFARTTRRTLFDLLG